MEGVPLPSPPLEHSVAVTESSTYSFPSSSIVDSASQAQRLEDWVADASQTRRLEDWMANTSQTRRLEDGMADTSAQEQHRSEAFNSFQPLPEEEQSSHERPQSPAPLRAPYDRNRRRLNLPSRTRLPSNQEQSVLGGRALIP